MVAEEEEDEKIINQVKDLVIHSYYFKIIRVEYDLINLLVMEAFMEEIIRVIYLKAFIFIQIIVANFLSSLNFIKETNFMNSLLVDQLAQVIVVVETFTNFN